MDINQLSLDSIKRYYNILKKTGTFDYEQVYKLFLLTYIGDLLSEEYSWYITEEDYSLLLNLINCISKTTCIVPYTNIATHIQPINNFLSDYAIRISENEIIRLAEEDVLRLINK